MGGWLYRRLGFDVVRVGVMCCCQVSVAGAQVFARKFMQKCSYCVCVCADHDVWSVRHLNVLLTLFAIRFNLADIGHGHSKSARCCASSFFLCTGIACC